MKVKTTLQLLALILVSVLVGVAFAWTYTYDTATPAGSDDPAEADDRMREIKLAVQEIMDVEHDWALTGTVLTGDGKHTDITTDSIVNAGTLANTGDLAVNTNKFTVTAASGNTLVAGTLDVTGVATLGDASLLKTSAAPTTDAMIAPKKYVDDQITTAKVAVGWIVDSTEVFASATKNATFQDLDLSSVVGSNVALVLLRVSSSAAVDIDFRVNGETTASGEMPSATENGAGCSGATVAANRISYVTVQTDSSGIVEWRNQNNTGNQTVKMVGYMAAAG